MKTLVSRFCAFARARLILTGIIVVQVAGLVTAAVSINEDAGRKLKPQADIFEPIGPASLLNAADTNFDSVPVIPAEGVVEADLSAGRPLPFGAVPMTRPAGAVVGAQNAFMSVSPDAVNPSTDAAISMLLTSFMPGESIQFYISGELAVTAAADNYGRLGANISAPAGEGYLTLEGIGPNSGKRAGGVFAVSIGATPVPGVAVGPHAVNPNTSGTFHMVGSRYPANTPVTIARNGVPLGTVTSDSRGRFFITIPAPTGLDTSAVYTASSAAAGTLNGQSVEERADAGLAPQGDQNVSRAYFDRAVFASTGATVAWVGEGFQPGETVIASGCSTGSAVADSNGTVSLFVSFGSGSGVAQCMYTGATSGRIARSTAQGHNNAVNVPAAINAPATLPHGGTGFLFLYDRLTPSQTGTIFIDGVSQGPASTNANGYGSVALIAPGSAGIHSVTFVGSSGQVAIAPLYVLAAGVTPTPTGTPTAAPTITPVSTPAAHRLPRVVPFR